MKKLLIALLAFSFNSIFAKPVVGGTGEVESNSSITQTQIIIHRPSTPIVRPGTPRHLTQDELIVAAERNFSASENPDAARSAFIVALMQAKAARERNQIATQAN